MVASHLTVANKATVADKVVTEATAAAAEEAKEEAEEEVMAATAVAAEGEVALTSSPTHLMANSSSSKACPAPTEAKTVTAASWVLWQAVSVSESFFHVTLTDTYPCVLCSQAACVTALQSQNFYEGKANLGLICIAAADSAATKSAQAF